MPRRRLPPRLVIREDRQADGSVARSWVIRDGQKFVRTGCAEGEIARAEGKLSEYLGGKHEPKRSGGTSAALLVGDILTVYAVDRSQQTARPKETMAAIERLEEFWGEMTAAEIIGANCRSFVAHRGTQSGARRDLEVLRAAVRYYKAENGMEFAPVITLPPKSLPRERWLTRSEAARLLWACLGWRYDPEKKRMRKIPTGPGNAGPLIRSRRRHLARFILIGLYTATRHEAIMAMQWRANTVGGWFDLESERMHRRGIGEGETKKRRPPAAIPMRLLTHLKRWKKVDGEGPAYVCAYQGDTAKRATKAFRGARDDAGLDTDVKPHIMRHTAVTWLMQSGEGLSEIAGFAGVTVEELQRTYLHHHPDFQTGIANAKLKRARK